MTSTPTDRPIAASAAPGKPRFYAIDLAKGVGILLVVFGHVWRGAHSVGLAIPQRTFDGVDRWIYSFHMPLFFFISGLFIARSAEKPAREFLGDKFATIGYAYLLWSLLHGTMQILLPGGGEQPIGWKGLADRIFLEPQNAQFWFLYVLLLCSLLFFALRRIGLTLPLIMGFAIALFLVKRFYGFSLIKIHGKELGFLYQLADEFLIFAAGACLSKELPKWLAAPRWQLPIFAAIGLAVVTFVSLKQLPADMATRFVIGALAGIAMTLAFCAMPGANQFGVIAFLGRISLQIYVAHTIAAAAMRTALFHLHVRNLEVHLTAETLIGVVAPVVLYLIAERLGVRGLFTAPGRIAPSRSATSVAKQVTA